MIEFKPIKIGDRALLESYIAKTNTQSCDLAFANIYCWQETFNSSWAIIGEHLVIRFQIFGTDQIGYTQPLGDADPSSTIDMLLAQEHSHGRSLQMVGLTEQSRQMLAQSHPDIFMTASNRSYEEYLYDADSLRQLTGKRYQPKRNHINKFKSLYPNYEFKPLTSEYFDECLKLAAHWGESHAESESIHREQRAMIRAFESFDALSLRGAVLLVEGQMVAFTYGSAVNDYTFNTHVEKADTTYEGAFPTINRLFAESLPERFTTINREEDLGLEGLRYSKMSYHPSSMLKKYIAQQITPRIGQIRSLWLEAFADTPEEREALSSFLIYHYSPEQMLSHEEQGQIVSMLHMIPFQTNIGRVSYIYAVATSKEYRGRGVAGSLLKQAEQIARKRGDMALVLIPAGDGLIDFYSQHGYENSKPIHFHTMDGYDFGTGDKSCDIAMIKPLKEQIDPFDKIDCYSVD